MRVKVARRGSNSGSEFWGCNAYRTKGCRGTCQVPPQEWDWFGLIPAPVSIIKNAQNSHRKEMAEFLEYDYGSGYGIFGSYADYDDSMTYFEQALEIADRYGEKLEAEEAEEIDQVLNSSVSGYSLSHRILETADRFGVSGQAHEAIAFAITENFAGSATTALVNMSPEYPSRRELGVVYLDDGSDLRFNRTTMGVQMLVVEAGL